MNTNLTDKSFSWGFANVAVPLAVGKIQGAQRSDASRKYSETPMTATNGFLVRECGVGVRSKRSKLHAVGVDSSLALQIQNITYGTQILRIARGRRGRD